MNDSIPSATDVRESLSGLTTGQVRAIAEKAGVPFTTLWKIKTGETTNPGIETVRRFYGADGLIFDEKPPVPSASRYPLPGDSPDPEPQPSRIGSAARSSGATESVANQAA